MNWSFQKRCTFANAEYLGDTVMNLFRQFCRKGFYEDLVTKAFIQETVE